MRHSSRTTKHALMMFYLNDDAILLVYYKDYYIPTYVEICNIFVALFILGRRLTTSFSLL